MWIMSITVFVLIHQLSFQLYLLSLLVPWRRSLVCHRSVGSIRLVTFSVYDILLFHLISSERFNSLFPPPRAVAPTQNGMMDFSSCLTHRPQKQMQSKARNEDCFPHSDWPPSKSPNLGTHWLDRMLHLRMRLFWWARGRRGCEGRVGQSNVPIHCKDNL